MFYIFSIVISMVVAWMPLRHRRRQIIILMSMLIVLRRLWTGICYFTSYCCLHINLSDYDLPFCSSRFAQFFIKPLMSPDATMREIKAVDSGSIFLSHIFPPPFGRLFPWTFCIFLSESVYCYFNLTNLIFGFLHLNNKKFSCYLEDLCFKKYFSLSNSSSSLIFSEFSLINCVIVLV